VLRQVIAKNTENRFRGFLSGIGVTFILQSSTATTLILSSFAKRGLIGTGAGIGVVIGADISTTLIAQILIIDLSWLAPLLMAAGFIMNTSDDSGLRRNLARVLIGLSFMLYALGMIRLAALPLQESDTLPLILQPLTNEPLLAVVVGALLTWLFHSSLASVLLFASLVSTEVLSIELGLLLVIGANIGGGLIPLAATFKEGKIAQRIPFANLIMRFTIALLCLPFVTLFSEHVDFLSSDPSRQIVWSHTGFNVLLAIVFLPVTPILGKLCDALIKETEKDIAADTSAPLYLDDKDLDVPSIALASAARETLRMAEIVERMLDQTISTFERNDLALVKMIEEEDDIVDSLFEEIKFYLMNLSREVLNRKQADRYMQIITFANNLESVGDIIDKSLMNMARKKLEKQDHFSASGWAEIQSFHRQVSENLALAQTIFLSEDSELAQQLVEGKKIVRQAELDTAQQHFDRLRSGQLESLATSSLHLDIIRDYRRINSYITSVAYEILTSKEKRRKEKEEKEKKKKKKIEKEQNDG
jgi:phosphate:Na+ symporter